MLPSLNRRVFLILVFFSLCAIIIYFKLTSFYLKNNSVSLNVSPESSRCPKIPPNRLGAISIHSKVESFEMEERRLSFSLQPGGLFIPKECKARYRVAILVPKRGREEMLPIFLVNLHSMLMKQQIEYGIFVVEQPIFQDFNRGFVFNVGFVEALKLRNWDCFIFHDIDLMPIDDRNIYNCPPRNQVRPMAIRVDEKVYKDGYGGVIALSTEQFKRINGFSNVFWNWGGEDDDLGLRIRAGGYVPVRLDADIGKYKSISHKEERKNQDRWKLLGKSKKYFNQTGLNSLNYHIKEFKIKPTHVHIFLDYIPRSRLPFK